jgi:uncharacterized membrane protein YjfL (UPF0719 family)
MDIFENAGKALLLTLGYTAIGLLCFGLAFALLIKLAPFSLRKELEEDQNQAVGIVIGSVIIGIALIVAATVHG